MESLFCSVKWSGSKSSDVKIMTEKRTFGFKQDWVKLFFKKLPFQSETSLQQEFSAATLQDGCEVMLVQA